MYTDLIYFSMHTHLIYFCRATGNDWNEALPIDSCSIRDKILGCAYRLIDGFESVKSHSDLLQLGLATE